jgi:hypothetical protein
MRKQQKKTSDARDTIVDNTIAARDTIAGNTISNIGSGMLNGFSFGAGSAAAHRMVGSLFAKPASKDCENEMKNYMSCMSECNDFEKCKALLEAFNACKR